jgi:alcohol dehydrogenase class IV
VTFLNFDFYMPVKIISGENAVDRGAAELEAFGRRCLIVTGQNSAKKSGALEDVQRVLSEHGIKFEVFDKVGPNPLISTCFAAGRRAEEMGADFIFGIGGGSSLDTAKAAGVIAVNPSLDLDTLLEAKFEKSPLPVVVAGTTAGTGSEVTMVSVLTIDGLNQKKNIRHPFLFARIAFANPRYTDTCLYNITVSSALDALSHATEGYFAKQGGDTAHVCSLKALELIWPNIVSLYEKPGIIPAKISRDELYYGSLWAGITLGLAGTGFPHPAGYVLTSEFGIPHGKASAVFLPDFIEHNASADKKLAKTFFGTIGCNAEEFGEIVSALAYVGTVELTEEQCEKYAQSLAGKPNLANAVNPSTVDEIAEIYKKYFLAKQ